MFSFLKKSGFGFILGFFFLFFEHPAQAAWKVSTIESSGNVEAQETSVAVDSLNNVHVCYYDGSLRYIKFDVTSNEWSAAETLDTSSGQYCDIAVDASNNIHISYYDPTNQDLKYIMYDVASAGWVSSTSLDTSGTVGEYSSIVVDTQDDVHITYYDGTNQDLKYIKRDHSTGSWGAAKTLDSTGHVGKYSSIAVDSSDNLYVSYYDSMSQNLKFKRYNASLSRWLLATTLDSTGNVGRHTSIVVDSENNVHISYYDATNENLKYIKYDSAASSWGSATILDSTAKGGQYTSIAVDSADNIHLSYYGESHLKYLRYDSSSMSWDTTLTLDSDGDVGQYTSIVADSLERVRIIYRDATNSNLKYAEGGVWVVKTIDGTGQVEDEAISLALDSNDDDHITYYTGYLRYLRQDHSTHEWDTAQTLDSAWVGTGSSMTTDASNNLYVSYFESTSGGGDLKFIQYDQSSATWSEPVTLTSLSSSDGKSSQVRLDSNGNIHIVYLYGGLKYIKYDASAMRWDSVTTLDTFNNEPMYSQNASLAIDSSDNLHISYYDNINDVLKYIKYTKSSSAWSIPRTLDASEAYTGLYNSIAVDSSKRVHISYLAFTSSSNYALKYTKSNPTLHTWKSPSELDSSSTEYVGYYSSISLDALGNIHVSYYAKGKLYYLKNDATHHTWDDPLVIDSDGEVGRYSSLKIDSKGSVHIAYYDSTNQALKYATNDLTLIINPSDDLDDDGDGYTENTGDCDDGDATVYPGASELCDAIDNNCDGDVDESGTGNAMRWYYDSDGDGYGTSTISAGNCVQPSGFVALNTDCDDSDDGVHPGAAEYCDGIDNDCDGNVDEVDSLDGLLLYVDADGDGYGDPSNPIVSCSVMATYVENNSDCDDTSAQAYPGASEKCDGLDNDCDGEIDEEGAGEETVWYADTDADGYGNPSASIEACTQPTGYVTENTDCDDEHNTVYPDADEICDGLDNDCNGKTDEFFWDLGESCVVLSEDCQKSGIYVCAEDGLGIECDESQVENAEICGDGIDNDCDGEVDEDCSSSGSGTDESIETDNNGLENNDWNSDHFGSGCGCSFVKDKNSSSISFLFSFTFCFLILGRFMFWIFGPDSRHDSSDE